MSVGATPIQAAVLGARLSARSPEAGTSSPALKALTTQWREDSSRWAEVLPLKRLLPRARLCRVFAWHHVAWI